MAALAIQSSAPWVGENGRADMSKIPWLLVSLALLVSSAVAKNQRTALSDGLRCLACERELTDADPVIVHRGRTVGLCSEPCAGAFAANPDPYFAKLSPRGAFLDEDERPSGPVGRPWFWFGVYVVAGLISAAVCAYVAVNRAQPPLGWFFAGLFGNVAALIVVLLVVPRGDLALLPAGVPHGLGKVATTRRPIACSACGRDNHPSATSCSRCGSAVVATVTSEVARVARAKGTR